MSASDRKIQFLAVCCLAASALFADLPPAVINYGKDYARDVTAYRAAYETAIARIPTDYKRNLESLQVKYQKAGDLDALLAVKNELERYAKAMAADDKDPFETASEMPEDAIVTAPAELRTLQVQYRGSFDEAARTLKTKIADRGTRYRDQIEAAKTSLTKAGRIEDAIAVKDEAERVARILDSGDFSQLLDHASSAGTAGSKSSAKGTEILAKWKYRGAHPFSHDLPRYFDPDVPNELRGNYDSLNGVCTVSGMCQLATRQVGDVLCSWNGTAFLWDVPEAESLVCDIHVKPKSLSAGAESGPHMEVAVLGNGLKIKSLTVPLIRFDDVVRIMQDASNPRRFALTWPKGKASEIFEIPANAKINILIGVTLHNPGESCDVSFQVEPSAASAKGGKSE